MDLTIPEEYRQLRESLIKFIRREIHPLEERWHEEDFVPIEEYQKVRLRSREVGFYGIHMPEELGCGGLNVLGTCLLMEEINRQGCDHFGKVIIGGFGGPTPILLACNTDQREKYLIPLVKAEKTTCFALTEPNVGSDATSIQTTAKKEGDYYIINGTKYYITNGPYADFAMVFAVTDKEKGARGGITCFLVDRGTPGFKVGRVHKTMTMSGQHSELIFEDCRVHKDQILGREGLGFIEAMRWINQGRINIGASCLGMADRMLKMSKEYAKQRVAFGKPIAERQAVQWMLADMATEIYAGRMMVYHAACMVDGGKDARKETSMVKLYASEMASRAVDKAIQIHGGAGFMRDLPIERVYRAVRAARIGEGTSEIQRWTIARSLLKD